MLPEQSAANKAGDTALCPLARAKESSHTDNTRFPLQPTSEVIAHTHIDNRLFKLDVQPVVGRCDDSIFCSPHILCELSVQLGKGNLATAADKAMQTDCGAAQVSGEDGNLWPEGWDRSSFSRNTPVGFLQHTCSKDWKIFTIDLRVEGLGLKMKQRVNF